MPTVAITGLRTFVGQRLAERLRGEGEPEGFRVVGLDLRRPHRLEGRVRFQRVDLTDPAVPLRIAEILEKEGVEVVVHCAFRTFPTADVEADHELETIGTLHLLDACAAARIPRLVVASSTQVYGARPDQPAFLEEDHPLRGHPEAHQVRNLVEVEHILDAWQARHPDTAVTVLRRCWTVGPTVDEPITRYFARPVVPVVLGFDPRVQLIHEADCLRAFERAVREPHAGVFNVVGRGAVPLGVLLRRAGRRPLPIPGPLLRRFGELPARVSAGDPPDAFFDYLRYPFVADGSRAAAAFGEPVYTTQEAFASFVGSRRMRRYR